MTESHIIITIFKCVNQHQLVLHQYWHICCTSGGGGREGADVCNQPQVGNPWSALRSVRPIDSRVVGRGSRRPIQEVCHVTLTRQVSDIAIYPIT